MAESLVAIYFADPEVATWSGHYTTGLYGGYLLAFTEEFCNKHLPDDLGSEWFVVELLDTEDGKVYTVEHPVSVEHFPFCADFLGQSGIPPEVWTLQSYFYGSHFCACNRKLDAEDAGAIVADGSCTGDRFQVQSITKAGSPELILYSETMSVDELERRLLEAASHA